MPAQPYPRNATQLNPPRPTPHSSGSHWPRAALIALTRRQSAPAPLPPCTEPLHVKRVSACCQQRPFHGFSSHPGLLYVTSNMHLGSLSVASSSPARLLHDSFTAPPSFIQVSSSKLMHRSCQGLQPQASFTGDIRSNPHACA
eukprot:359937-Chlamydomonas_euryale.AAC.4